MTTTWLSLKQAAGILGVSQSTLYRIVANPETANTTFGAGNWRTKPLVRRPIYQLAAARVTSLAQSDGETPTHSPSPLSVEIATTPTVPSDR